MATLREYFFKDLETFGAHSDLTVKFSNGNEKVVVERVHFDTQAGVNYVSYFFPEGTFDIPLAHYLLVNPSPAIERVRQTISTQTSHPTSDPEGTDPMEQSFSGRVYFYIDDYLEPTTRQQIIEHAATQLIGLKVIDRSHADYMTLHEHPWAFISHDSRDKDELARPLAEQLSRMLCSVWYDEYSLKVGMSLRESIDEGIRVANKCVLVLSPNFMSNPGWGQAEFNAVMGKHIYSGGSVILPIWHNVERADVYEFSPLVADIAALQSAIGVEELARKLFLEISPAS